jgi:hypothetical protein
MADLRDGLIRALIVQPPIVDGIPYRANVRPTLPCAGWSARRRALTAREEV